MQMFNAEHLQEKWAPILDYNGLDRIQDPHRRMVTAVLLENQEVAQREERAFLSEAAPTMNTGSNSSAAGFSYGANAAGPVAGFDPVLISLIRRSMPNLVAYDLAGVQLFAPGTLVLMATKPSLTKLILLSLVKTHRVILRTLLVMVKLQVVTSALVPLLKQV